MTDRSIDVHKGYMDAQVKFDYYILGMTAALFGYLGGQFVPEAVSFSSNTIELCSLVCFMISIIFSIKKLESDISFRKLNFQKLDLEEKRSITGQGIMTNKDVFDVDTGKMMSNKDLRELSQLQTKKIEDLNTIYNIEASRGCIAYSMRNGFLMSGVILLAFAKVLGAFIKSGL